LPGEVNKKPQQRIETPSLQMPYVITTPHHPYPDSRFEIFAIAAILSLSSTTRSGPVMMLDICLSEPVECGL
jgi:hypothetical protein